MRIADHLDVGTLVHADSGSYDVVIAEAPEPKGMLCYGVRNKATCLLEGYTNSLARARELCTEFQTDLMQGTEARESAAKARLAEMFAGAQRVPGDRKLS